MVKRYGDLCAEVRRAIEPTDGDAAPTVARELVSYASGKTVEELLRDADVYASDKAINRTAMVLKEYQQNKPLPYILGEWSFYGAPLTVDKRVLIPRDDTMVVTDFAIEKARKRENPRVLDLCTGSGCIGIAVALAVADARVTLADISAEAQTVAKLNTAKNHLQKRVSVVPADALGIPPTYLKTYDVLVANPPYITKEEMAELPKSVSEYEPHLALYGGEDGLDFYREICKNYSAVLVDGGWICLEFGRGQETAIAEILCENGFENIEFRRDTGDIIRAVAAQKKEGNYDG